VDDFAVCLLTLFGYVLETRMTRTRADIPLTICGEQCHVETDVCVVDEDDILLLVRKTNDTKSGRIRSHRLIAEAIAAFQANNTRRTRVLGQDAIDAMMPALPWWFLAYILQDSCHQRPAQAVALGAFLPPQPSCMPIFLRCLAPLAAERGMKPLDSRTAYFLLLRGV